MSRFLLLAVGSTLLAGCGSGIARDEPLFLAGTYDASITPGADRCGVGAVAGGPTSMGVSELPNGTVEVNLPDAGACDPRIFVRNDKNTITHARSETISVDFGCGGLCDLQVDTTVRIDFGAYGTFDGQRTDTYAALAGACGCASLPCTDTVMTFRGTLCLGCFQCARTPTAGGSAAGARAAGRGAWLKTAYR